MIIQSAPPGPASLFTMSAFGRPDTNFQQQLQLRNQQTQQHFLQNYGFDSSNFFASSNRFFDNFKTLTGMVQAETMISMGKVENVGAIENNIFTPITSIAHFQTTSIFHQTLLMANPLVREQFLEGKVHGYGATYVNHWGNNVGWDDPVFRQAVCGLSQHSYMDLPDDVDDAWVINLDDPIDGIPRLSSLEQSNLAQGWKLQNVLHDEGIDTTHPELKPLGD